MKKLLLFLFFTLNLLSYSDYLLTNSEIVAFYDTTRNEIRYIKGNLFKPIDISEIKIILKDDKNIYDLNNYVEKVEKIKDTGILKITYKIKDKKIKLSLLPSIVDKSNLYMNFNLLAGNFEGEQILINFETQSNKKLLTLEENKILKYENFNITTSLNNQDYNIRLYDKDNGKEFILKNKEIKLEKYNISYELNNLFKNKSFLFKIKFDNKKYEKITGNNFDYEEKKWQEEIIKTKIKDVPLKRTLENLYLLTDNILIPNKIAFEISEEIYSTKAKLLYLQKLLNFPVDPNQILNEIVFRKSTLESIELYTLLFKLIDEEDYGLPPKLFKAIVRPQVLSILDMLNENGEILGEEDNIKIYYELDKLVNLLKNRHGFEKDQKYILKTKQKLENYVNKYYFKDNRIKTRRYTEEYNIKNIKYINIFNIKNKKEYLNKFFKEYYSEKYSLLLTDRNYIDINFNLTMIALFYKHNLDVEAEKLFMGINKIMKENQGYLTPRYNLYSKNRIGIFGNTLYLYINAYRDREKILEKK